MAGSLYKILPVRLLYGTNPHHLFLPVLATELALLRSPPDFPLLRSQVVCKEKEVL